LRKGEHSLNFPKTKADVAGPWKLEKKKAAPKKVADMRR